MSEDLTGQTFNRWHVVRLATEVPRGKGHHYLVRCFCGTEKIIQGYEIKCGNSKSCGCLQRDNRKRLTAEDRRQYSKEYYAVNSQKWKTRYNKDKKKKNFQRRLNRVFHFEKYRAARHSPRGRYNQLKQAAAKRKKLRGLPLMSFSEFLTFEGKPCHYCGLPRPGTSVEFDRVNNSLSYAASNVLPACKYCNLARSDHFTVEEMVVAIGPAIRRVVLTRQMRVETTGI